MKWELVGPILTFPRVRKDHHLSIHSLKAWVLLSYTRLHFVIYAPPYLRAARRRYP